eukprot:3487881-Rhodomonas_salina.5
MDVTYHANLSFPSIRMGALRYSHSTGLLSPNADSILATRCANMERFSPLPCRKRILYGLELAMLAVEVEGRGGTRDSRVRG